MDTLQPDSGVGPFDLVISGPNFGRNTGTAFSLSSGTIGAALAASLSGTKAISLSYGHFQFPTKEMKEAAARYEEQNGAPKPPDRFTTEAPSAPVEVVNLAHKLSCRVIDKLYRDWEEGVGVYSVNVPLSYILRDEIVFWTSVWGNKYGQLFKLSSVKATPDGPGTFLPSSAPVPSQQFRFGPNMSEMLQPRVLPEGTDIWAIMKGYISVSRLEGRYSEIEGAKGSQGRFKL